MAESLIPTFFNNPELVEPVSCCCGVKSNINVNVDTVGNLLNPDGTVSTRTQQAAIIIRNAQKRGFVVFQGM